MLERYHRELLNFLDRALNDREAAADLTQESYVRVLAAQQAGRPIRHARALLYQTARNLLVDRHRRTRVRDDVGSSGEGGVVVAADPDQARGARSLEPEVIIDSRRNLAAVVEVIEGLPPRCREAFILHRFEGLSCAEIGERMGISVRTVEMQLQIAMKACWRSLAGEVGSEVTGPRAGPRP